MPTMIDSDSVFDAYGVGEFCRRHHISRSHFYDTLKEGDGPQVMKVGSRTLISVEAAARWRREREDATLQSNKGAADPRS
jgi:predicted DNA-binding transcriptional regulator AlpA